MECLSYVGEAFHDSHLRDTGSVTKPVDQSQSVGSRFADTP